jgi:putative NADH-flavin reductase
MKTYAVIGGTGSTGSSIINQLLQDEEVHLNVYARSAPRLSEKLPHLSSNPRAKSYIGPLNDTELLADCLENVDAAFFTVATNYNEPHCSIAQETAHSAVSALEIVRSRVTSRNGKTKRSWICPPLVILSSAGMNPILLAQQSWLFGFGASRGCYWIYRDLSLAEEYLRSQDWLSVVFVQPNALVHHTAFGVRLDEGEASSRCSYADLADAMVLAAEGKRESGDLRGERSRWIGKNVGVTSLGGEEVKAATENLKFVIPGFVGYYAPTLWDICKKIGLW